MNKFRSINLDNGAKLYYAKNNINKATFVDVNFDCGSRCDTFPGLAHFVEHMFFTGTKNLTKDEITKKYFSFVNTNAYTNNIGVFFSGSIFTKELPDYLSTVATMIAESTFSPKAIEKERKIINQEIVRRIDKSEENSYYFNFYNLTNMPMYKYTGAGTRQTIANITSKDVKNFVNQYFIANNAQINIVTPLSANKVKKIVEKNLISKLKVDNNFVPLDLFAETVANDNFVKIKKVDIKKCIVRLNFVIDKDFYDLKFLQRLNAVISMMTEISGGINNLLRIKKSLIYSCKFNFHRLKEKTIITFVCQCEKENVGEVISTVAEYMRKLYSTGFSEEEIKLYKRKEEYYKNTRTPSVGYLLHKTYNYKMYNKIINDKKLEKYVKKCTKADFDNTIKEVLSNCKVSLSIYGSVDKNLVPTKQKLNEMYKFN